jgi:hypothetical protein
MTRYNTQATYRKEYETMGFTFTDVEKGGAMTPEELRTILNLNQLAGIDSATVILLALEAERRAAFRAGYEAAKREHALIARKHLQRYNGLQIAQAIEDAPIPEMDK